MQKTFIGPHLRRLRQERNETQGAMARTLGISASYVNLLENNERSVSVQVLLRVFEAYGVDWRDIADDDGAGRPNENKEESVSVEVLALTKRRTAPTVDARNPAVGALPRLVGGRHPPIHASMARMTLQTAEKMQ